jgi:hypothetical protein
MPKAFDTWTVLEHGPIERLEPNLWIVVGSLPNMQLKRVMVLVRLDDGRIVIHGAIALNQEAMAEIEAWGTPSVLLVPNAFHRLDAPSFVQRYPDLKVYCPRGGRSKIEEVVRVDGDFEEMPPDAAAALEHLEGLKDAEGVMTVRSPAGTTLVFNDAIFNLEHGKGLAGFIFRYITASTGGPKVTRMVRLFLLKDQEAFRAHLERLADTPDLKRVIVAHGRLIEDDPAGVLRKVAADLG